MTSRFLKIILVVAFNAWWCCALSLLLPTLVLAQSAPPLPDDIRIESPATDLPPEIKEFSGAWEGEWREAVPRAYATFHSKQKVRLKVILVVEKVWDQGAIVVFAWGDCPDWRISKNWGRYKAKISSDGGRMGLTFATANAKSFTFFINNRGHLEGTDLSWGMVREIEMTRRENLAIKKSPETAKESSGRAKLSQTNRSSSPYQKIELSTKNLAPEVQKTAPSPTQTNKLEQYYVKKPKNVTTESSEFLALSRQSPQENQKDRPYFQGVDYIFSGNYGKAISEFNKVLSINTENGEAYFSRGVAFIFQGQYSKAIADFNQYLQFEPNSVRGLYNRGLVHALQGQYGKALADFNKTLALNPQDAQAYYLRGFVYYQKGRATQARSDYQKALNLNPYWVRQAASGGKTELDNYALILQGKAPKSSKAAALKTEAAHKQQALTLAKSAKYDQALAEINQALTQDPKDAETYNRRGGIYTLQGHYTQAVADFSKALELNPRYAKAYYNRALAYYYQGKYDQAINDLTKAIELKPKDVASYNNRGLAYMQKGNYERAIDDFNVATILNPKLADAYFNKAVSCEKAGRREEAREAYAAFVKLAPPGAKAQIKRAQRKLR